MKKGITLVVMALMLFLGACGDDVPALGVYHARIRSLSTGSDAPELMEVSLELKAGGEGAWITRMDATPVKWDVKDSKIILHGKSGGVMTGEFEKDGLRIIVPGVEEIHFVKEKK